MFQYSLDLSFFSPVLYEPAAPRNYPVIVLKAPPLRRRVVELPGNSEEFTEAQIFMIRERLLKDALEELSCLADSDVVCVKLQETLDWFWSNDLHPFSFRVCLDSLGYAVDADEFRSEFVGRIYYRNRRVQPSSPDVVGEDDFY